LGKNEKERRSTEESRDFGERSLEIGYGGAYKAYNTEKPCYFSLLFSSCLFCIHLSLSLSLSLSPVCLRLYVQE
jgi:hypothetical protein